LVGDTWIEHVTSTV